MNTESLDHLERRLDDLEDEVKDIQRRISEMRSDQDALGIVVTGFGGKLDALAGDARDSALKLEVALNKQGDVLVRMVERLTVIEGDVSKAKSWLMRIWPLIATLSLGAAGGETIKSILKGLVE